MTTRQSESNHVMGIIINSPAKLQNALNSLSSPQAAQALLETLNFIRECMKMNKIYPNFHFFFLTKIEIKMTHLVFLFCYLLFLCF